MAKPLSYNNAVSPGINYHKSEIVYDTFSGNRDNKIRVVAKFGKNLNRVQDRLKNDCSDEISSEQKEFIFFKCQ